MTAADPVARAFPGIAARLRDLAGDIGIAAVREVKHLEPATVAALRDAYPDRVVVKAKKQPTPYWSQVGNVDVLMSSSLDAEPLVAIELKWCHIDKLYEGIWDLFKMSLLATNGAWTYLLTGAKTSIWNRSVGRELFEDGTHRPVDLCQLRLPWGQKLRAWDDLLSGGYDRYPEQVPSMIATSVVGRETIITGWELRAVRVAAASNDVVKFAAGWPFRRPPDAVRPLGTA